MKKKMLVLLLLFFVSHSDAQHLVKKNPKITLTNFSKLIYKYEILFNDSAYCRLNETEKLSLIRVLNTISVYKEIYEQKRYGNFYTNMLGDSWLIRIVNDLDGSIQIGDAPFYYRRYFFEKYDLYFGGPDLRNSMYIIIGLKPEHSDVSM